MPVGSLLAAYAYHVFPQQTEEPVGGTISVTPDLAVALDSTFDRSKVATAPVVSFKVDTTPESRKHVIRDAAMTLAFSETASPETAQPLAIRLAEVLDNRSSPTLLLITAHSGPASAVRRFLLWTFPQQEVFDLNVNSGSVSLNVRDAFIRESSLRKVAYLEGQNNKTGMLQARVLDFQASSVERTAADLWIVRYLDARLQMSGPEGSRILARALRSAFTSTAGDQQAQDEITNAISAVRSSPRNRWSITDFSTTYLGPVAGSALSAGLGPEVTGAAFDLDLTVFDSIVQYKRFTLEGGVVVSAPFGELEEDGRIEVLNDADGRRLKVEGRIEGEGVRSRG